MTDTEKSQIKIKRSRKRLYDPLIQEEDTIKEETESPAVQTESVNEESKALVSTPAEVPQKKKQTSAQAKRIIHNYVKWSAGTALIPLPVADMIAVTAIQLRMLKKLCDFYGITFSEYMGKVLIGSLIGGANVGLMSASLLKVVPVFGLPVSISSSMVVSGAITYAVGIVFIHHFENGGTLKNFKPSEHKKDFVSAYQEAEKQV